VYGDTSALAPGGIRIGSPALTSRGLKEEHFRKIAEFLDRGLKIGLQVQTQSGKLLKDFAIALENNEDLKVKSFFIFVYFFHFFIFYFLFFIFLLKIFLS
jgi:hypothetical protein